MAEVCGRELDVVVVPAHEGAVEQVVQSLVFSQLPELDLEPGATALPHELEQLLALLESEPHSRDAQVELPAAFLPPQPECLRDVPRVQQAVVQGPVPQQQKVELDSLGNGAYFLLRLLAPDLVEPSDVELELILPLLVALSGDPAVDQLGRCAHHGAPQELVALLVHLLRHQVHHQSGTHPEVLACVVVADLLLHFSEEALVLLVAPHVGLAV